MTLLSKRSHAPSAFTRRLDVLIEQWSPLVPIDLREDFRAAFARLGSDHDSALDIVERVWERRERAYAFDESTGLARRRPFRDHLAALLETPESPLLRAVGVLFIDLDDLKHVNDTYGHDAGDKAVTAVGAIIRDALRADPNLDFVTRADPKDGDFSVSRYGGDEFLVALELKNPSDIEIVAPRIKRQVDDPDRQRARGYPAPRQLTVSVGGVVYVLPPSPPAQAAKTLAKELVTAADEQMYESKRDGRVHILTARFTDRLEIDRDHPRTLA